MSRSARYDAMAERVRALYERNRQRGHAAWCDHDYDFVRPRRAVAASALAALLCLGRPAVSFAADDLVTPIRVGREDAPIVLSFWAQQEYSHLAARPEVAALFQDILRDWAIAHPDVRLDVSTMPALEMHKSKLLMAAASDRLPDVASIDSFWMPLFLDGGHVKPLDPFWPAADRDDFLPFTIDTLKDQAGHVYGMWHGTDCRVLYYRKDLVPDPPKTWDELIAMASRISHEKKISGRMSSGVSLFSTSLCMLKAGRSR